MPFVIFAAPIFNENAIRFIGVTADLPIQLAVIDDDGGPGRFEQARVGPLVPARDGQGHEDGRRAAGRQLPEGRGARTADYQVGRR